MMRDLDEGLHGALAAAARDGGSGEDRWVRAAHNSADTGFTQVDTTALAPQLPRPRHRPGA
ncbi:hypothetical protein ACIRS3_16955 [Streptomyces virginiae]|uniref:hypothetical protein n=1 Tax=Streptomyces virginiae TaxID=1961 RepID=UPI00380DD810